MASFDAVPLRHAVMGPFHEMAGAGDAASSALWADLIERYVDRFVEPRQHEKRLHQLWKKVQLDLARPWTLKELAGLGAMSPEHLRRRCQRNMGRSPMQQLTVLRIQHAAHLLATSDEKFGTIAHGVGLLEPVRLLECVQEDYRPAPVALSRPQARRELSTWRNWLQRTLVQPIKERIFPWSSAAWSATQERGTGMIIEIAQFDLRPGMEVTFEAGVRTAMPIFTRAKGCRGLQMLRSIEKPSRYCLVIKWDTVENHTVDFRGSSDYQDFRKLVSHCYAAPPNMQHRTSSMRASELRSDDLRRRRKIPILLGLQERPHLLACVADRLGALGPFW